MMTPVSPIVAVIPAAGIGNRMQSAMPKQYIQIGQKTILEHTVDALFQHPAVTRAVIALNPADDYFKTLPLAKNPRIQTVIGGKERADSVLAGLALLNENDWALVHDAARPCLHIDDLTRLIDAVFGSPSGGILAAPVSDTIKRSGGNKPIITETVDRRDLWRALTPQLFPALLLRDCLEQALTSNHLITDEASALEFQGFQPQLISGRGDNIKVTRQEDIAFVQCYLQQKERQSCE